jgi:type II secretory ATPase GspE/PulE/Tfp pilus assembly ATPase PilB-like protein
MSNDQQQHAVSPQDQQTLFERKLQAIASTIAQAGDCEQTVLNASEQICQLLHAERLTLYLLSADQTHLEAKVKTGLAPNSELKLPITSHSVAGYVAQSRQAVNIADVYDAPALKRIHPSLTFLGAVDKRTGFRTREMLVAPILGGGALRGVLQVINNKHHQVFAPWAVEAVSVLAAAMATSIGRDEPANQPSRRHLASKYDGLVAQGVLSQQRLDECLAAARAHAEPAEFVLLEEAGVSLAQLGASYAAFFQVAYEPMSPGRVRAEPLHGVLKRDFIEGQGWLPLEDSPAGLVLMCLDPEAVRSARVVPQVYPRIKKFDYRVTTLTDFQKTFEQIFGIDLRGGSIDAMLAEMSSEPLEDDAGDELATAAADNELVKLVNQVILDAYHQGASDIHIEPLPGKLKTGIRFRIDGTLHNYIEVPAHFRQAMVTRLKIMCELDISERRKPQDGKIKFKRFGPLDIELRVATIPSAGGVEDVVMRILSAGEPLPLEQLGLTAHNQARVLATVEKPYGLFYVCGPTGSGKTTTLHSILKHLNTPDTKIWTCEDPVEITQRGLRQVQINRKAGIDFALVMRAFLRADPDIIMVGESRDHETVSMGVEASLTGHLVFSTLHTNSAPESITRLLDMGMDPFNFADALLGVLAQRLAKRLCGCKQAYVPDAEELRLFGLEYAEELRHTAAWQADFDGELQRLLASWQQQFAHKGELRLYRRVGCEQCKQTGYKGRVGLHELLIADDDIKQRIQSRARVSDVFAAAVAGGMRTLKMDGMEKVLMGLTDLKMVRAVCIR